MNIDNQYKKYTIYTTIKKTYNQFYEYYKIQIDNYIEKFIQNDFDIEKVNYNIENIEKIQKEEIMMIKKSNEQIRNKIYQIEKNQSNKKKIEKILQIDVINKIKKNE